MRYISTSSITLTFFSGYYGFQAYSWEGSMLVQASRNLRNTLVHVHAWSWWLTCNLDNWVLCANKLLKSLQPLPDPIFFPLLILSPWICDHETDWWCHLWVFITWDSVQKTVLGFPPAPSFYNKHTTVSSLPIYTEQRLCFKPRAGHMRNSGCSHPDRRHCLSPIGFMCPWGPPTPRLANSLIDMFSVGTFGDI